MAKSQVQFTKDNEYYTPKAFVDRFGKFDDALNQQRKELVGEIKKEIMSYQTHGYDFDGDRFNDLLEFLTKLEK